MNLVPFFALQQQREDPVLVAPDTSRLEKFAAAPWTNQSGSLDVGTRKWQLCLSVCLSLMALV